ncbi:MAG: phage terminase large subunit [Clostridiales bacterium]|nr:phage terminase large subunit [Clostridiales bacterium]
MLFDEVALMPRTFVEQALARCSVPGSKFWFNCNPEYPEHWFYTEWIKQAEEKNALYLHFTMDDNPSLEEDVKRRYESLYSGVFYERFVRGQVDGVLRCCLSVYGRRKYVLRHTRGRVFEVCDFLRLRHGKSGFLRAVGQAERCLVQN